MNCCSCYLNFTALLKAGAVVFIIAALTSCKTTTCLLTHEGLNGVLWTQTSPEFQVSSAQAFQAAAGSVDIALQDLSWTAALEQTGDYAELPPAVIVDVDETVLDNSPFQARMVARHTEFTPEAWEEWVNEIQAEAMPGAREFINYLKSREVKIFYVTNRVLQEPTLENIQIALDPDVTAEDVLCKKEKPDWGSDKTSRRQQIADAYRILLLVGDDYNDFTNLGTADPAERIAIASEQKEYWGVRWIMLSNPHYGNWERALYDSVLEREEKVKSKYKFLKTKSN